MRKGKPSKHAGSHEGAIATYHIAALCPLDYLERSVRTGLLARAPCADVLATRSQDREVVRAVLRQLSSGNAGVSQIFLPWHRGAPISESSDVASA